MKMKKRKITIILSVLSIVGAIQLIVGSFGVSHNPGFTSLIILGSIIFAFPFAGLMLLIGGALDD